MKYPRVYFLSIMFYLSCQQVENSKQSSAKQSSAKQGIAKQGNTFDYYPRANIYYDIEQKFYYVFDSVPGVWQQKNTLTPQEYNLLNKKVLINNPPLPVYLDNDNHRLIYGTLLYSSSEQINKKFIEDSLKSLQPKKANQVKEKEEKRKGGLKKFLDNIFRKKEK